jgi:hypothetical protein
MTRRGTLSGPLALMVWLVAAAGVAAMVALAVLLPRDLQPALFASLVVWIGSFGFVGGLIAIRVPGNPVGWLLWLSGACASVAFAGSDYAGYSIEHAEGTFPGTLAIAWLASWMWIPAIALTLICVPLLFPDGRLPSRRWRAVAVLGALGTAGASLVAFAPVLPNVDKVPNPLAIPQLAALIAIVGFPPGPLMAAAILISLTAPIVRYRRAGEIERRQLKWFGFVLVIVVLVFALAPDELSFVSLALLPVAIGIAILRYRLYDIDRIISRTVSYAALTAILAAVFVGGVVSIQVAIEQELPGNSLAVVASTLAVAILFQPLRRRIQAATDRRFNRPRYDAQRTVDTLAGRLRVQADLRELTREVLSATTDSVQPSSAWLWLREGGGRSGHPGRSK